jgi:hypothetical protein
MDPMVRLAKLASVLGFSALCFGTAIGSAHAFQIIDPAKEAHASRSVSAFTVGGNDAGDTDGMMLSQKQINHIRWCAANYRSYNPTDDTVMNGSGRSVACRSPY